MKQSETKNETWLPIANYEGLYEVSDKGNVRSIPRYGTHTTTPTNISPHIRSGYYHVTLWKDGVQKDHTVHRLVATAFLPNKGNLPCINHKDEVKTNNRVENLEWCTYQYNYNYSNVIDSVVEANGHKIVAYRGNEFLGGYRSIREAGRTLGIGYLVVRRALNGGKTRCGLTFKRS